MTLRVSSYGPPRSGMTDDHIYARLVAMWREGLDTLAIAERLSITEAKVYSLVNRYVGSAEAAAYRARKRPSD